VNFPKGAGSILIHIGICDDSADDIRILTKAIYAYDPSFRISTYSDGKSLIEDCEDDPIIFDILFIDIYMPGLNGIKTAERIRTLLHDTKIIFISSSKEHYQETYDVFAFNYLVKPLNPEKLHLIMDQALVSVFAEIRQKLTFSFKNINHQIFVRDIKYLESKDKRICVYMSDGSQLVCYKKLEELLKQLPETEFVRCHQSFVVNIYYVTEMTAKYFRIGSVMINISRKYWKASKDKYFDHLFSHMDKGTDKGT